MCQYFDWVQLPLSHNILHKVESKTVSYWLGRQLGSRSICIYMASRITKYLSRNYVYELNVHIHAKHGTLLVE